MAEPNRLKLKSIPMKVGNDPALWHFASLERALEANTDLIAWAIHARKEQSRAVECKVENPVAIPIQED